MQQAQAEGLTLLVAVAANATGYFGVSFQQPGKPTCPTMRCSGTAEDEPGLLRHRRGGGAEHRAYAGGAGGSGGSGGGSGRSASTADEYT